MREEERERESWQLSKCTHIVIKTNKNLEIQNSKKELLQSLIRVNEISSYHGQTAVKDLGFRSCLGTLCTSRVFFSGQSGFLPTTCSLKVRNYLEFTLPCQRSTSLIFIYSLNTSVQFDCTAFEQRECTLSSVRTFFSLFLSLNLCDLGIEMSGVQNQRHCHWRVALIRCC